VTIATQADVEALLQRPLSVTEAGYVGDLLTRADALIYRELPGYRFTGSTASTATIPGSDIFEVWLPGRPVTAVDSVTLDGQALVYGEDYDWAEFGDVARTSGTKIWARTSDIDVVWHYGLDAPPPDVVAVAADMVKSAISNPTGIRQESVGSWSATYEAAVTALGLTLDHRRILNHYHYPVAI
jgi:hypothetical protein